MAATRARQGSRGRACGGENVDQDCAGVCFGTSNVDNCDRCVCGDINDNPITNNEHCTVPIFDQANNNIANYPCTQDCVDNWGGYAIEETYFNDGDGDGVDDE